MSRVVEPADPLETTFRHSHWKDKRARVRAILTSCNLNEFKLDAFDQCGSACRVEWSETEQRYRLSANYCHSRHCEPCMRSKANRMAANLKKRLREKPDGRYRFLTLTLRHSKTPLKDQLNRLYESFKKLRNTKFWKESQNGGVAIVEIKRQANSGKWHPHLHIISEGAFIRQAELSAQWQKITGDSKIVDIRALKSGDDAAHYVSKYITKGTSNDVWKDTNAAQEWVISTKGLRTCTTFGKWRGFKLLAIDKSTKDWAKVDSLVNLINRARSGEEHAANLLAILRPPGDADAPGRRPKESPPNPANRT